VDCPFEKYIFSPVSPEIVTFVSRAIFLLKIVVVPAVPTLSANAFGHEKFVPRVMLIVPLPDGVVVPIQALTVIADAVLLAIQPMDPAPVPVRMVTSPPTREFVVNVTPLTATVVNWVPVTPPNVPEYGAEPSAVDGL